MNNHEEPMTTEQFLAMMDSLGSRSSYIRLELAFLRDEIRRMRVLMIVISLLNFLILGIEVARFF